MKSEFLIAVTQLAAERNLPREKILSAIEAALASAYRKANTGAGLNVSVKLTPGTGEMKIYALKTVVEEVEDPHKEIGLAEAHEYNPAAQLGDTVQIETEPRMGRIEAQTAKQVVMQRLREAERELVFEEYAHREGDVVSATVQRMEMRHAILDLGRAEAILPASEQVPTERYRPNQRLKVYILEVRRTTKGPEIIVSRAHKNLLRRLFELEVPEIYSGVVEIKAIAREPGFRTKVAVFARQEGVDPVGSCVGLRGIRIQNVVNELQGERIDVVPWHKDLAIFIANALSPAHVMRAELDHEEGTATVVVPDRQLSLAIGREGQNARLAAKMTGWKIDIKSASEAEAGRLPRAAARSETLQAEAEAVVAEAPLPEVESAVAPPVEPETVEAESVAAEAAAPVAEGIPEEVEAPSYERIVEELEVAPARPGEEEGAGVSLQELATPGVLEEAEEPLEGEIWTVPPVARESASGIRFAEDILPDWGRGGGRGKKRGKGRGDVDRPKRGDRVKGTKGGGRAPPTR